MKTVKQTNYSVDTFEKSESEWRQEQDYYLALTARICVTIFAVGLVVSATIMGSLWICHR